MKTPTTPEQVIEHYSKQQWYKPGSCRVFKIRFTPRGPKMFGAAYTVIRTHQKSNDKTDVETFEEDRITVFGYRPTVTNGKKLVHIPKDPREWYFSCYLDDRKWTANERARYEPHHPLGPSFDLMPTSRDEKSQTPYEVVYPDSYKRLKVWLEVDGKPVEDPKSIKRPWPFPKFEPMYSGWTRVSSNTNSDDFWYQYNHDEALCARYGESQGVYNVEKAIEAFRGNITTSGDRRWLGAFWTFPYQDNPGGPKRSGPKPNQVLLSELLSMMHKSVHRELLQRLTANATTGPAKVVAYALFENVEIGGSNSGARSIMPIGPEWTIKTIEAIPPYIYDLPSQRQYIQCWARVDFNSSHNQL